jgi:hypothetical protein
VLERAAECRLRRVADVLRDERDRKGGVAEQVGGGVQAYVGEIGGWRLPNASDEPRSERRPGKAARSGQVARLRVADRECSAEPARRLRWVCVMLGGAVAHGCVRALACVADVVRVAARERRRIGKVFRRSRHCLYPFLGLRSTNSEVISESFT